MNAYTERGSDMFNGFTDETFEFFMAIAFNNNTEFFHANHDWYVRAVRQPCLELAGTLSEVMTEIDDEIELRPNRVVSCINRELRYARDKSPYKDYMWLKLRRPAQQERVNPGFYFDISARESSFGMGFYEEYKPHMNGFRRRMVTEPETVLGLIQPLERDFDLHLNAFKRMKRPEALHPALTDWYPIRSFWFVRNIDDFSLLKSPALVDLLAEGFQQLAPLYRYIRDIPNEDDEMASAPARPRPARG